MKDALLFMIKNKETGDALSTNQTQNFDLEDSINFENIILPQQLKQKTNENFKK